MFSWSRSLEGLFAEILRSASGGLLNGDRRRIRELLFTEQKLKTGQKLHHAKSKKLILNTSEAIALGLLLVAALTLTFLKAKVFCLLFPAGLILLLIQRKAEGRQGVARFEHEFPAFLISVSSSIRCGLDPVAAVISNQELFAEKSLIHQAIREFKQDLAADSDEVKAVRNFAAGVDHPDLGLFKQAFILSRTHGSSLSVCLQRISKAVRQRQSFRRKVRAAVALQKLSAFGILFAVLAMFLIQLFTAKTALLLATQEPLGQKLLMLAAFLMLSGLALMFKVSALKTE